MICSFSYGQQSEIDSAYFYLKNAKKYHFKNDNFKAYSYYNKAKTLYTQLNIIDSTAVCNLKLYDLIKSQNNLNANSKQYLDAYYNYSLIKKDTLKLLNSYLRYAQYYFSSNMKLSASYYHKVIKTSFDKNFTTNTYANLALLYTQKHPDSAKYYFEKTLDLFSKENKNQLFGTYINYANFYQKQKDYKNAIKQLKKAEQIEPTAFKLKYYKILHGKYANCYKAIGDYKSAYKSYEKYNSYRDSLNNTSQNIAIKDLDKKYQTAEKEKQILIEQQKNKQKQNLLYGSIAILLFGGSIAFLSLKNSRKKRLLAEQQQELETQKNITLLKEQEITSINAMVSGQEKERKRIAEDLHDNIGSVLATLKLHFENLKLNRKKKQFNQEDLYLKTEHLIDETYLKVRSLAHAKNAGVISNQGLLAAVKTMAEKISSANKIKIEVINFGLDKPLENSLEITVFRIIQELTTNIIKHAKATIATINISLYDTNLSIIVEDNGNGFNKAKIDLQNGMGIGSIKTRIEHLNGTFEIDSTLKKGTTIIIDLPI